MDIIGGFQDNLQLILQIVTLAVGSGALLKFYPTLMRYWAERSNLKAFAEIETNNNDLKSSELDDSKRRLLYSKIIELCDRIINRSRTRGLDIQADEALRWKERAKNGSFRRVRFFIILPEEETREICESLILKQNYGQSIFQFELGHVNNLEKIHKMISAITTTHLAEFVEGCEKIISDNEVSAYSTSNDGPIRIVITQNPLPKNYYLWGHFAPSEKENLCFSSEIFKPNEFWVVSTAIRNMFHPDIPLQQFILRVIQRACILSILPSRRKGFRDRLNHKSTFGCLFDFTSVLADAQFFVLGGYICEGCAADILEAKEIPLGLRSEILQSVQKWVGNTRLKTGKIGLST